MSTLQDAGDLFTMESTRNWQCPDSATFMSVDLKLLRFGQLCWPSQHSLGAVPVIARPPIANVAQVGERRIHSRRTLATIDLESELVESRVLLSQK